LFEQQESTQSNMGNKRKKPTEGTIINSPGPLKCHCTISKNGNLHESTENLNLQQSKKVWVKAVWGEGGKKWWGKGLLAGGGGEYSQATGGVAQQKKEKRKKVETKEKREKTGGWVPPLCIGKENWGICEGSLGRKLHQEKHKKETGRKLIFQGSPSQPMAIQ